jgi:hypothetical protein
VPSSPEIVIVGIAPGSLTLACVLRLHGLEAGLLLRQKRGPKGVWDMADFFIVRANAAGSSDSRPPARFGGDFRSDEKSGCFQTDSAYTPKLNERVQPRDKPEKDDMVDALRDITSGLPGNCSSSNTSGMLDERICDLALIKANSSRWFDLALIKANSSRWFIDTGVASPYFLRLFGAQGLHRVDFGGAPCG